MPPYSTRWVGRKTTWTVETGSCRDGAKRGGGPGGGFEDAGRSTGRSLDVRNCRSGTLAVVSRCCQRCRREDMN